MDTDQIEEDPAPAAPDFAAAVLDSVVDSIVVLGRDGVIVWANAAWRRFATANDLGAELIRGIGMNYLELCHTGADKIGRAHV